MTERHLQSDPPTPRQIAAVKQEVDSSLARLTLPLDEVRTLVGVAGTVTTMAAMTMGLTQYDRERIHGARVSTPDLLACVDRIVGMSVAERKELPFLHPGRADVIGGGALVLECVLRRLGLPELLASEHDILDGIAWSIVSPTSRRPLVEPVEATGPRTAVVEPVETTE
jgi:exopolyphosphatase/guanosine-5'-triphosphate,3'-diphosphate pyrophosphatase